MEDGEIEDGGALVLDDTRKDEERGWVLNEQGQSESAPNAQPTLEGAMEVDEGDALHGDEAETAETVYTPSTLVLDPTRPCERTCRAVGEFKDPSNFTKGTKFSPDGTCLLTCSDDNVLRVFELPQYLIYPTVQEPTDPPSDWRPALWCREGESVYDMAWYPLMTAVDPSTCVFASTSRDHPIHLWDAFTGELRASYRAYDHLDELAPAYCLAFTAYGDKILAGFDRMVRVFDTSEAGRNHVNRPTCKTRRSRQGQRGIISALAVSPDGSGTYAAGSFSGGIGLYDLRASSQASHILKGHTEGVTALRMGRDGHTLVSGGRKDPQVHCWDLREPGKVVQTFKRAASTNQRIGLDIEPSGRYVATGSRDHQALIYDLSTGDLIFALDGQPDCVNDVAFHPYAALLALGTGQRHFTLPDADRSSGGDELGEVDALPDVGISNAEPPPDANSISVHKLPTDQHWDHTSSDGQSMQAE